jgi:hypothetical protein
LCGLAIDLHDPVTLLETGLGGRRPIYGLDDDHLLILNTDANPDPSETATCFLLHLAELRGRHKGGIPIERLHHPFDRPIFPVDRFTIRVVLVLQKSIQVNEGVRELAGGIDGGEIQGFGRAVERDGQLLILLADSAPQLAHILVDPVDSPLEQRLRIELMIIPVGIFDDARHLNEDLRPTKARFMRVARRRQPTA